MPPRKDPTGSDDSTPSVADQLAQLIAVSTNAAKSQQQTAAQLAALLHATETLHTKLDSHSTTTARLVNHITELSDNLHTDNNFQEPPRPPRDRPDNPPPNRQHRPPKINLPMFDGSNPLGWIFQADNYFTYFRIPPPKRVAISAFHCTGDALAWYQNQAENDLLGTWTKFKRQIETRFGLSSYENHEAALFKLTQQSTVSDYLTTFEKLSNRVTGLSPQQLLNCFLSGLKPDIRSELTIQKPTTLHEATGLARLVEDKLALHTRSKPYVPYRQTQTLPSASASSTTTPTVTVTKPSSSTTTAGLLPTPAKPLPFHKLTPEAIQQRRREGLCFRCPARYSPGHVCSPPQFLFIVDHGEPDDPVPPTEPPHCDFAPPEMISLSLAAFYGMSSSQTLRLTGYIMGKPVTVLIDCGSTHNIMQPRIAASLPLSTLPSHPFPVMVGNGQYINCEGHCPSVPVQLQNATFDIPFFIFQIHGADIVLGIAWLASLGPLCADFSIPEIAFTLNSTTTVLRGEPLAQPLSRSSFASLLRHESVATLHALTLQPVNEPTVAFPTSTDPTILNLLQSFTTLFATPHTLPPTRHHDHHIPLLPDTPPVNVRPYRYPHFQKQIMTQLISEMLRDGVIRPSQSPFSSPVLLVKKKDGSSRFCVDYRALNKVTIRDRFPIPTIDELLDELHGASIFSKIDLRSGYHQIRVAMSDIPKTAFRTSDGHYEFLVMPFGLSNAPSTFQSAMNDLFRPVLRKFVLVFFDDILIYSRTTHEHYSNLRTVFEMLTAHQFFAKASKCTFGVPSISFLGHLISADGVSPEQDKIQAIKQWPTPTSFTTLHAFLGLTGYYRRFVPQYAHIALALTDILK